MTAGQSPISSTNRDNQTAAEDGIDDLPLTVLERARCWFCINPRELWAYRELLYFFVWRDVKVRYKQTAIGATWALLQPLMTMLVYTFIFGTIAHMPSDGFPYPLYVFTALIPWNYFAKALNNSINSVVGSAHLISKVYFPRILLPVSAALSWLIDLAISFSFLLILMAWFGQTPTWGILTLPLFVALTVLTALSVSLWLSVINVRYRDVGQAIPFLLQLWMFVSPVAYPVSEVPSRFKVLYSLNPMTGVIEGFRWALLGKEKPPTDLLLLSTAMVLILLWGGIVFFKRMEQTFADVV